MNNSGWIDDQWAVEAVMGELPYPVFGDIYGDTKGSGKGRVQLLHKVLTKVAGRFPLRKQAIGDCVSMGAAMAVDVANWKAVEETARGQTVYFNAWRGAQNINDYIRWAAEQVREKYGVTVNHTKLDDTANAVSAVVAAKAAGVNEGGEIDLIWINGENFVNMKKQGLLLEAGWAQKLPNWQFVDC